jgi:endo-beta-N-acetylglucosaminidase D
LNQLYYCLIKKCFSMKKARLFLILSCFVAIPVFATKHDNYIVNGDVSGWMYSYYGGWTPGSAPSIQSNAAYDNFFIGRQRPLKRFINTATDPIASETKRDNRKVHWWVPINESSNGWTSLPRYDANSEAFSSWSYIDIYGNWTQGFLRCPGNFTDICHKNGVANEVVSAAAWGVGLNAIDGGHGQNYNSLINGGADKLMKLFRYYGIDGLGFNSEQQWNDVRSGMKNLLKDCHNYRTSYDVPFLHFSFYNLSSALYTTGGGTEFSDFFPWANAFFLNYNWGQGTLNTAASNANSMASSAGLSSYVNSYDVYGGMDMQGGTAGFHWEYIYNTPTSVGLWGAHDVNQIWGRAGEEGNDPKVKQACYLKKCEQFFTGGTQNPVNNLTVSAGKCAPSPDFHGVNKLVMAKSALSWQTNDYFPFISYMNLGIGTFFNNEGVTTYNDEWYNIGMQDHLPTWRWWITDSYMSRSTSNVPSDTHATFTFDDAWFGGSCLKLTFDNAVTGRNYRFIQMYKTQFPIDADETYKIRVRYKALKGKATMAFAMSAEGTETIAVSQNMGTMSATDWTVLEADLTAEMANKVIAQLGMRFNAVDAGTEILIGEVALVKEGVTYNPVEPQLAAYEVLKTTYKGVDFKMAWNCPKPTGESPDPEEEEEEVVEPETAVRAANLSCSLAGVTSTRSDRYLTSLTFSGTSGASLSLSGIQSSSAYSKNVYYDYRSSKSLEVKRGETISTTPVWEGSWMQGHLYVDWNNDGDFADSGEYVASPMNINNGTYSTSNYAYPKSFTIPDGVALGTYTIRYTIDWNSPSGNDGNDQGVNYSCGRTASTAPDNYTADNGGCMVDFELHVTAGSGSGGGSVEVGDWQSTYNDEVDTWYFEIWAQQDGGEPQLVTTTTSWAAYAVDVPVDLNGTKSVRVGSRAVAPDGTTKSEITWSNYMDCSDVTILEGIEVDKPVIKANEEFTVSFTDPSHGVATRWRLLNADGSYISNGTFTGGTSFTTNMLSAIGLYGVEVTYVNSYGVSTTEIYNGLVKITVPEVGAMPRIDSYTIDGEAVSQKDVPADNQAHTLAFTSRDADGSTSKAVEIEDVNSFTIDGGYLPTGTPITVAFWCKIKSIPESMDNQNHFFTLRSRNSYNATCGSWYDAYAGEWKIMINNPTNNVDYKLNVDHAAKNHGAVDFVLPIGDWFHVAIATNASRNTKVYINGVQRFSSSLGMGSNYGTCYNFRAYIGGGTVMGLNGFNGSIDDIQIWHKQLSESEVKTAMNGFPQGTTIPTDLKGYWDLEEYDSDGRYLNRGNWSYDYMTQNGLFKKNTNASANPRYVSTSVWKSCVTSLAPEANEPRWGSPGNTNTNEYGEYYGIGEPVEVVKFPSVVAGSPMLSGSYVITTVPKWEIEGTTPTNSSYTATSGSTQVAYSVEGTYKAKLTLVNDWGSSETMEKTIVVYDHTVGLNPLVGNTVEVTTYPNPFVNELYIQFAEGGDFNVEIMDVKGQLLYTENVTVADNAIKQIAIKGNPGMYIVRLSTTAGTGVRTFKVEKK